MLWRGGESAARVNVWESEIKRKSSKPCALRRTDYTDFYTDNEAVPQPPT